ncbi:MAG: GGDEF domain-containing protein [Anaerorhabdus sp.]|uniref:GGDEF domain-containing protein n=1 Tax=Anaerorhabdus sp. TaxID=1872524 RepID=UPI003A8A8755
MNSIKKMIKENIFILSKEQTKQFNEYFPHKVYKTERNISIIVALTQVIMMILFLFRKNIDFHEFRIVAYFSLYIYLFLATVLALVFYKYTYKRNMFKIYSWLRRIYCFLICMWLMGITLLDQAQGADLSVFSYLLPTMAAVLLVSPMESVVIFGSTWGLLITMLISFGNQDGQFGIIINSIFVTVLSIFISFRYYRSMAIEFCDRLTIENQYKEIKQVNHQLEDLVHVDQLTGLYNRHYLHQIIYPMFNENLKNNLHSMCLILDIDFFKQYNDNYGHLKGDECIKQITKVIREFCDRYDANAIRYGGEEFLIIKVDKNEIDALVIANELLCEINKENITRDDLEINHVTVSIGIWSDSMFKVETLETAIHYADNALYEAKAEGRNRIA